MNFVDFLPLLSSEYFVSYFGPFFSHLLFLHSSIFCFEVIFFLSPLTFLSFLLFLRPLWDLFLILDANWHLLIEILKAEYYKHFSTSQNSVIIGRFQNSFMCKIEDAKASAVF